MNDRVPGFGSKVDDFRLLQSFLYGCLLGDGCIIRHKTSFVFTVSHSIHQNEYTNLKSKILNRRFYETISGSKSYKPGSKANRIDFSNKSILEPIYKCCVTNSGKIVSDEWLNKIDEFALAIWYQDDGSWYRRKTKGKNGKIYENIDIHLHTDGFSKNEVEKLSFMLLNKFCVKNRLRCKKYKNGKKPEYWSIVIQDNKRFWEIVAPWSIMRYKFNWDTPNKWFDHDSFGIKLKTAIKDYNFSNSEKFSNRRYIGNNYLSKIAKENNLNEATLRGRINSGYDIETAILPTKKAKIIIFNGEQRTIGEWAKKLKMNRSTLHVRITRWGVDRALSTPISKRL